MQTIADGIADRIYRLSTCVPDAPPRAGVAPGASGCMVSLADLAAAHDSLVNNT